MSGAVEEGTQCFNFALPMLPVRENRCIVEKAVQQALAEIFRAPMGARGIHSERVIQRQGSVVFLSSVIFPAP